MFYLQTSQSASTVSLNSNTLSNVDSHDSNIVIVGLNDYYCLTVSLKSERLASKIDGDMTVSPKAPLFVGPGTHLPLNLLRRKANS